MIAKSIATIVLAGMLPLCHAASLENFDTSVPTTCTSDSGTLTTSADHYKSGSHSLSWEWSKQTSSIDFRDPVPAAKPTAKQGFAMWCWQENPNATRMKVDLLCQGKVVGSGWFWMDYQGWRILGANYRQFGVADGQTVDTIRLHAPKGTAHGKLIFDMVHLGRDYTATRTLQMPWATIDGGLQEPKAVVLSARNPSLNRPWLPEPPQMITAGELADIRKLESAFLTQRVAPGKGLAKGKLEELRTTIAAYQIHAEGDHIRGRPIDGGTPLKPDGCIAYGDFLKTCDAVKSAYYQAQDGPEADELKSMFVTLARHLIDQGWAPGSRLASFDNYPFGQLACFYAMKDVLAAAGLARPIAQSMMDNFGSQGCGDFTREIPSSSMDGLGFWNRELFACSLLFPTPAEQLHHLLISRRFLSLAIRHPATIAPDGCTYHHGGFHYAYASYNMPRLLQALEKSASTRFRIDGEAQERIRVFVRALAFTSSAGEQAYNLGMRAGTPISTMGVEPVARMLATMGTPDGKNPVDTEMAAISLRLLAESGKEGEHPNFSKDPWKSWLASGIKPASAPNGFLAMNGGPIAIHRRPGWIASIAGITPHYRCVEIYGWTHSNNYGRFARNGSMVIASTGSPPNLAESGWAIDGWNWCHFPGTTALRVPHERDIFDGYAMYGSSPANVGGTTLGPNGIWGNDFNGIGVRFRKTYFCFDKFITSVTTDINATKNDNANPVVTTLFQNALLPGTEHVVVNGRKLDAFPAEQSLQAGANTNVWILDNKRTGYLIPAGNGTITITAKRQSWKYMTPKYLVDPKQNPISGDKGYQRVRNEVKDLSTLEKFYRPSEGDFTTAWFDHGARPASASAIYTAVIHATPEEMAELSASPPQQVLQAGSTAHIVHDGPSDTYGYAIYEGNNPLPESTPLRSCSHPSFLMLQKVDSSINGSLVYTCAGNVVPPGQNIEISLTITGEWKCPTKGVKAFVAKGTTTLVIKPVDNTPVIWTLNPVT